MPEQQTVVDKTMSYKSVNELENESIKKSINWVIDSSSKNKKLLQGFYDACLREGNHPKTIVTKLKTVRYLDEFLNKDFKKVKRGDIERFLNKKVREIEPTTFNIYKVQIKTFFRWLYKLPPGEYPKVVDGIELNRHIKSEEKEVLTRDEIKRMLNVTTILRDNCLLSVLYDGGLRISECVGLRMKDILWDGYGCRIKVTGKTGTRHVRLINSVPVLKQWVSKHPFKESPDHCVFISLQKKFGQPMFAHGARKVILRLAKNAGIKKKVHPHIFRHTKLTELASEGILSEMELRTYAGWNKRSQMTEIYLHSNERNVDEKLRNKNGLVNKEEEAKMEKERKVLKPRECPMCEEKNDISNKFCFKCGQILDVKAIKDIEATKDSIVDVLHKDNSLRGKIVASLRDEIKKQLLADLGVEDGKNIAKMQ